MDDFCKSVLMLKYSYNLRLLVVFLVLGCGGVKFIGVIFNICLFFFSEYIVVD